MGWMRSTQTMGIARHAQRGFLETVAQVGLDDCRRGALTRPRTNEAHPEDSIAYPLGKHAGPTGWNDL